MDHGAARRGNCGRISKLTEPVKVAYREIFSRYAYSWTCLSEAKLWEELGKKGYTFSTRTIHEHLKLLKKRYKKVYLKPILTEQNKILRMKYALDQIDRSHGKRQLRFKDNKAHNGGKRRKRETGSACDFAANLSDYDRCVRLCI
jgi:hypothetical protein